MLDRLIKIILLPISIILSIVIVLLRPLVLVRLKLLADDRIGHFAQDTAIYLLEKKNKLQRSIDIFCFSDNNKVVNQFLKKKWKKKLNLQTKFLVTPIIFILNKIYFFLPFENKHNIYLTEFDKNNLINKQKKTIINFSSEEKKIGNLNLNKIGVPENKKFIVLIIRDQKYLKKNFKYNNWDYHKHINI